MMDTLRAIGLDRGLDSSLVAAAKRGNAQAFEEIVSRHKQKLLAVAQRITNNREDAEDVTAIALHTTPGIPQYMDPVGALLTNGVEMDVLGIAYSEFADVDREAIVAAYPRTEHFKEDIIQIFYDGIKHKPGTTFGNVKADVLADKDSNFQRMNFCSIIRSSEWKS